MRKARKQKNLHKQELLFLYIYSYYKIITSKSYRYVSRVAGVRKIRNVNKTLGGDIQNRLSSPVSKVQVLM